MGRAMMLGNLNPSSARSGTGLTITWPAGMRNCWRLCAGGLSAGRLIGPRNGARDDAGEFESEFGEEWDRAYDYLARGNAQLLETLRRRFVSGPIDWAKEWGAR